MSAISGATEQRAAALDSRGDGPLRTTPPSGHHHGRVVN
jgi:hypothetical protein